MATAEPALRAAHEHNKEHLEQIATSPPAADGGVQRKRSLISNPLLQRGKLKRNPPSNNTKKKGKRGDKKQVVEAVQDDVKQTRDNEAAVVEAAIEDDNVPAPPTDTLDLADELLEQLDARDGGIESDSTVRTGNRRENGGKYGLLSPSSASSSRRTSQDSAGGRPIASPSSSNSLSQDSGTSSTTSQRSGRSGESSSSTSSVRDTINSFKDKLHIGSPPSDKGSHLERKPNRQQARKLRKESAMEEQRKQAQAEVEAANDQSIEQERRAINLGCEKLGVLLKEIEPDGHCLYSAVADQLNLWRAVRTPRDDYKSTRRAAARYMRSNPDEFIAFLENDSADDGLMTMPQYEHYCDQVESSAEWGGQPEIQALAKAFGVPIHVLQEGTDLVKVGEEVRQPDFKAEGQVPNVDVGIKRAPALLISYHRKMYGLGEHYNSLRPRAV